MNKIGAAFIALLLPVSALASPENYTIDPYHSFAHFEVDHLGFTKIRGRFDRSTGKIMIDRAAKTGSLDVTVQTASVSTGDSDKGSRARARDDHLRSPDFFNVAEFPTMTVKSTRVVFKGDNPDTIETNVTLLGVTKPMSLHLDSWKCGAHPANKRELCGGTANGTIKRTDFGMKFGVPAVGDELKIWIGFEAYKD